MVSIILGNVKLLLCPDLGIRNKDRKLVPVSRRSRMQRLETDRDILPVTNQRL